MFEEMETTKKHNTLFTVLGVFVLLLTVAGVAVAAYTWSYTSDNANTIGTGSVAMSYLESTSVIAIEDALPMSDTNGKLSDKFDFAVTTNTSGTPGVISYTLQAEKVSGTLKNSEVKVYLEELGTSTTPKGDPTKLSEIMGSDEATTGTLLTGSHDHSSKTGNITTKYRLRMWIDGQVDASLWKSDNQKNYVLRVNVSGSLS